MLLKIGGFVSMSIGRLHIRLCNRPITIYTKPPILSVYTLTAQDQSQEIQNLRRQPKKSELETCPAISQLR